MRRLFKTLPGKALCQFLVLALILPSFSLMLVSRASAQLSQRRVWAVMPFVDQTGGKYGTVAADVFSTELSKRQEEFKPPIDVASPETVKRTLETLGLASPVTDQSSFLRVGQELRANTLVRGELVNYRIVNSANGKQAQILLRVEAVNVASGLAINGAALQANSSVHSGTISDEALLAEGFSSASSTAVNDILSHTLPSGTVLNTYDKSALINQGTRTGFAPGQKLIVLRGREQVATAVVRDVEPDQANIDIVRAIKGIEPGDQVTVIFEAPTIANVFTASGQPKVVQAKHHGTNSGLISVLLIVALGVLLLGMGNGGSTSPISNVTSEATLFPDQSGQPAVRVSWRPDIFAKGNSQRYAWQVYRSDVQTSPVFVVSGDTTAAFDTATNRAAGQVIYSTFGGVIGGTGCNITAPPLTTNATPVPGVTPGRAYTYAVELVYSLTPNDLPGGLSSSSSGGNTGGGTASNTGGGTNTGTNTGTTGGSGTTGTGLTTGGGGGNTGGGTGTGTTGTATGGSIICYFVSGQAQTHGIATPLNRPTLTAPADNSVLSGSSPFSFNSVVSPAFPITVQYVIQFSPSPLFPASQTFTSAPFVRSAQGVLSTDPIDTANSNLLPAYIRTSSQVFFRIGARNVNDSPGPIPDQSGQRYIFSAARRFTRPISPPGTPTSGSTTGNPPGVP